MRAGGNDATFHAALMSHVLAFARQWWWASTPDIDCDERALPF
jgi:hypothetical protein